MKAQISLRARWRTLSILERILTILHLVLCAAVLVMAVLRLCSVVESMTYLFFPMGGMLLTQAYLFRKDNRTTAIVDLVCGLILLVSSTAILLLELFGGVI